MDLETPTSAVRALELWDGALDALDPLVHALEALTVELAPEPPGADASTEAPLAPEAVAAWMRLDAVLLAALARLDLASPEGRHYGRRFVHLRELVRTRGPLARPRRRS